MSLVGQTDALLVDNPDAGVRFDIAIDDTGDILTADQFDTAIIVSLFTDKRALPSQVLENALRRGWIGSEFTPGFEMGSQLWIFSQARLTRDTINAMISIANESLKWMISSNLAISTKADVTPISGRVVLQIEISRPDSKVEKRLFDLWNNSGVTSRDPI